MVLLLNTGPPASRGLWHVTHLKKHELLFMLSLVSVSFIWCPSTILLSVNNYFPIPPWFLPVLENPVFSRVFGTKDPNLSSCLEEFCYNTSVEALFSFCLREFHMAPLQSQQEQWAHITYSGWAALSVVLRTWGCFQKGKAKRHVRVVGRGGVPPFDRPWPKSEPVSQERSISAQLSGCHILNF